MRTLKADRPKKLKTVPYRFIRPDDEFSGKTMYALLRELLDEYHHDVREARFALAWNLSWEPDVDGRVILGQCRKVSDLEREVFQDDGVSYDFIIVLRQELWTDPRVTDLQRKALLDHELCHAAVKYDESGEPVVDECGRTQYRIRKHDLEEFSEIARRYGVWKADIEDFANALDKARVVSRYWIGYTGLRDKLLLAGADVPLDVIHTWSESERREAETWAVLRGELNEQRVRRGSTFDVVCPTHVSAAATKPIDAVPADAPATTSH